MAQSDMIDGVTIHKSKCACFESTHESSPDMGCSTASANENDNIENTKKKTKNIFEHSSKLLTAFEIDVEVSIHYSSIPDTKALGQQ